jgi:hypothetical protein
LTASGTRAPGALDLYLEGRGYALDYQKPGNVDAAIDRFRRAIELDGRFAHAQAGLGGALWLKDDDRVFRLAARWNLPQSSAEVAEDESLPTCLQLTGWVIDLTELSAQPKRYAGLELPRWMADFPTAWLIIPLPSRDSLLGFVVLAKPRTPVEVNWEVRDLLKTASKQAASFLGHVRAT